MTSSLPTSGTSGLSTSGTSGLPTSGTSGHATPTGSGTGRSMSGRRFVVLGCALTVAVMAASAAVHVAWDPYGLFRDTSTRTINIWHNERTSKYLLAHRYVPENFDGLLIGPSLAANLDTSLLLPYRVFNGAINGGNITELSLVAEQAMNDGKMRFLVVCLTPYITQDHGRKSSYMVPAEYWGALGSLETFKLAVHRTFIALGREANLFTPFGRNHYNILKPAMTEAEIRAAIEKNRHRYGTIRIDEEAVTELDGLLDAARGRGLKVFAYFYPYLKDRYTIWGTNYDTFKARMMALLEPGDVVWDMNTPEYDALTRDYSNYYDMAHLSDKGSTFVLGEIRAHIESALGPVAGR